MRRKKAERRSCEITELAGGARFPIIAVKQVSCQLDPPGATQRERQSKLNNSFSSELERDTILPQARRTARQWLVRK